MEGLIKNILTGLARHALSGAAAAIISYGVLVPMQTAQQETDGIVGSGLFLLTLAFSAYDKYRAGTMKDATAVLAARSGVVPSLSVAKNAIATGTVPK